MLRYWAHLIGVLLAVLLMAERGIAQEVIAVQDLNGVLVARCTLRGTDAEIPANLVIDLGSQNPLVLHTKTAEMLGIGPQKQIDLAFEHASLAKVRTFPEDLPVVEQLTANNSVSLGELPVVGILGLGAFQGQIVQLDLPAGVVRYSTPDLAKWAQPTAAAIEYQNDKKRLAAKGIAADGSEVIVQWSTQQYESWIDPQAMGRVGLKHGAAGQLQLGDLQLAGYGPLRPSPMVGVGLPRPQVVLGTKVFRSLRVTFDTGQTKVQFEKQREPSDGTDEQELLLSLHESSADGIEQYLSRHGESVLSEEAALALVGLRINQKELNLESGQRAVAYYVATVPADHRAKAMLDLADELSKGANAQGLALADVALTLAEKETSADLNATAIHGIHVRRGILALKKKDYVQARRLLLSAAFGMPQDPEVNYWLGEMYRQTVQPQRAWSRFAQAAIAEEPLPAAIARLDELNRDVELRKQFDVNEVQVLLEGRVPDYWPTRTLADGEQTQARLVELFTQLGNPKAVGAELAFAGLQRYYADRPVVFVQYHLDTVLGNSTAEARATQYGLDKLPTIIANGVILNTDGGEEPDAPRLFDADLAGLGTVKLPSRSIPVQLKGTLGDGKITGDFSITGNLDAQGTADVRLHLLLCERTVFALGNGGPVFHLMVARSKLTPADGTPIKELAGKGFHAEVDLATVSQDLDQQWKSQPGPSKPTRMRPTWVDPGQCQLVGILQDQKTHEVLAVVSVAPEGQVAR